MKITRKSISLPVRLADWLAAEADRRGVALGALLEEILRTEMEHDAAELTRPA